MILVDTSVWIDHLRKSDSLLADLLQSGQVAVHPFVIGEISLGSLKNRAIILDSLSSLPTATVATDGEVAAFIEARALAGTGIGYLDAHLLASVMLMPGAFLWTRDKKLRTIAATLNLDMKDKAAG